MPGQVACCISFKLDNKYKTILIDTIEDVDISLSSTITTHPVANGDLIADHMYKEPLSLTIKGSFSSRSGTKFELDGDIMNLSRIQKLFERIKNEAILCDISKVDNSVYAGTPYQRFLLRRNLVLSQINWTEGINTLGFTFSFTEVMITKLISYDVNTDDNFLPSVGLPKQTSFSQTFLNWSELETLIISIFMDNGLITRSFYEGLYNEAALIGAGVFGIAAGATYINISLAALEAGASTGPIGLGVVAIGLGIAAIGWGIYKIIDNIQKSNKYKINIFEDYQKDKTRFENFMGNLHKQIIEFVNNFIVYEFYLENTNESKSIAANIYNDYYIFKFDPYNVQIWKAGASSLSDEVYREYRITTTRYLNGEPTITSTGKTTYSLPYEWEACNINMKLNKNADYHVFLLKAAEYKYVAQNALSTSNFGEYMGESGDYKIYRKPIPNKFYIFATPFSPADYWTKMQQLIYNSFLRNPS